MRNQLNFYPVRSAKTTATADRLARPAFARGPNTTFNTEMSFRRRVTGRVVSPLTAVLNHALRRTQRQSRSYIFIYTVLLTGMFALVLAGCGGGSGGGGGNGGGPASRAVSDIQTMVSGNNITVSWTNPNRDGQDEITGFNINWVNVGDDADTTDRGERALDASLANVSAGASDNTHTITDLTYNTTYNITIAVRYESGDPVVSVPVRAMTGMDPDGAGNGNVTDNGDGGTPPDTNPLAVSGIATEVRGNNITVSWTNPEQDDITGFNITWINIGDDALPTDRGDIVLTDPPASVATGADNTYKITNLTYATTYEITVTVLYAGQDPAASDPVQTEATTEQDPTDIDGDGVPDAVDNCPLVANADQINTDKANDGGDACDSDDDNDGEDDLDDNCQLVANADQANADNDLTDGGDACDPDDDNDGTDDDMDVDDNNNSLIEIHNLNQLALLRGDLNGDGNDDDENDGITAIGSVGLPGCSGRRLCRLRTDPLAQFQRCGFLCRQHGQYYLDEWQRLGTDRFLFYSADQ